MRIDRSGGQWMTLPGVGRLAPANYSHFQRIAHWTVLGLCLAQFPTGWAVLRTHMSHAFVRPDPFDLFLHEIHAWSGWAILLIALARLVVRFWHGAPPLPASAPEWQRTAAHASHALLYLLLIAIPLTGTLTMYISMRFGAVHSILVKIGIGLVVLHALAALWHQFVRRDGLITRMVRRLPGDEASTGSAVRP